jgi:UDP-N-acetylglucosamine acyltransferase
MDGRLPTYGVEVREGARIFEFVTIHAGIARPTEIGQDAAVFNHSHVGHDAVLERGSIIGGHCSLAGHVHVMHEAQISGKSCVRHRVVVGAYGFLGANSFLTSHLPPGELWNGSPARRNGNNEVGLERAGLTHSEANDLFLRTFDNLIERAPL